MTTFKKENELEITILLTAGTFYSQNWQLVGQ